MIHQQYKLFLILFISLLFINLSAQDKIEYNITGNRSFEDDFYINIISQFSSNDFENLNEIILNKLSERGYFFGEIIHSELDTAALKDSPIFNLEITEGSQTLIRDIIIDSINADWESDIMDEFKFLKGDVFIESEIENRIENIIAELENIGHPFAEVNVKSIHFDIDIDSNSVVDIYISIDEGIVRKIDKVEINGNTKTSSNVILNAARLRKGEVYSQERIEEIPAQLNKLRFFKSVVTPEYFVNSKDEGILKINVVEKNTNTFDGILGYVPSVDNNESGYLTGFVNIGLRNLFGTGRALAVKWQQENSLTQELELKYLEPWIFNEPFNLNLHFFQRKQDSSYVKRIIGGSIEYLATNFISASVIIESESTIPSINKSNLQILNSTSFNSGIQLKIDYRDDIYSPTRGTYFESTYKYRLKTISSSEEFVLENNGKELEYHNYELDFGIYYSLIENQVIALGVHAKEIIGEYFDLSDFFQFGGTNSLRGYREKQFIGNRIIWSNLEYRFLLSQTSYVFSFYDSGYYLLKDNENIENSDFRNGYGFGISLDTALGIMKVSYALSDGSSITNGFIHFGLVNDF